MLSYRGVYAVSFLRSARISLIASASYVIMTNGARVACSKWRRWVSHRYWDQSEGPEWGFRFHLDVLSRIASGPSHRGGRATTFSDAEYPSEFSSKDNGSGGRAK